LPITRVELSAGSSVRCTAIEDVDDAAGVIGLRVGRDSLKSFL
jgi:hypothetical protein